MSKSIFALRIISLLTLLAIGPQVISAPTELLLEEPVQIESLGRGVVLVDFGRVAFGNLKVLAPGKTTSRLTVRFGEALENGRVDRRPPGSIRYAKVRATVKGGQPVVIAPGSDKRNTSQGDSVTPPAILTPDEWGVLVPFRWVEIHGWHGDVLRGQIKRRAAFLSGWKEDAAVFTSSDTMLNRIWELSRYSIKATTFAGLYVDGDRERIPYEADSYLNQLSHYYTDDSKEIARDTFDHLMRHGTWPTEWASHMVFMAHADWMHTADLQWLATRYESLKEKMLLDRKREDGLVLSNSDQIKKGDIVDWPPGERDGYVFTEINTVVNAFHLRSVHLMAQMAAALGKEADVTDFNNMFARTRDSFQQRLFVNEKQLYRDGIDTDHISLHANLFPLAFDLVPQQNRYRVAQWLETRSMACSVYAAQYLLEALFENGAAEAALALITAPGNRSWRHMVESGATITWEAWDMEYKPNQDWNHAWGAAPANLLPRYVLGVRPLVAGWTSARISPNPGGLSHASGRIPTQHGPILVSWESGMGFSIDITLPQGVAAKVDVPAAAGSTGVAVNGLPVKAVQSDARWVLEKTVSGHAAITVL